MNSTDWIQAFSTAAQALFTIVLVLVTGYYAKKSSESAAAAEKIANIEVKKLQKGDQKISVLRFLIKHQLHRATTEEIEQATGIDTEGLPLLLYEMLTEETVKLIFDGKWMVNMEKGAVG